MNHLDHIENMRKCADIFGDYMYKTFNVDVIKAFPETNPRKLLYDNIMVLKNNPQNNILSLKELNNICLNKMRDFYVRQHGLIHSKKPNQRSLDREQHVFGSRPINSEAVPMPINTAAGDKKITEIMFNQLRQDRDMGSESDKQEKEIPHLPLAQISEKKMEMEDFQRQLKEMEKERAISQMMEEGENAYHAETRNLQEDLRLKQPCDPQKFYNGIQNPVTKNAALSSANREFISDDPAQNIVTKTNYDAFYQNKTVPHYSTPALKSLQQQPDKLYLSPYNYIVINGYDRDWVRQKSRFQFTIEMTGMSKTYKNIHELSFTKLIIPSEIINERSVANPMPKSFFAHNYQLTVPYLMLILDEINDVCDGVNQANQKAFVHFIQDACYRNDNGRGYTILKPMQDEKKVFHPTPLSALPKLTLNITKPNGSLFNNAMDKYHVWKIEYEEYNRQYLKIVLDKYFDKNEFYKGDVVFIKKFIMPFFDKDSEDVEDDPAYQEYTDNAYTYNRIMDFINRPDGHDIIEIGKTNAEGFYRNFMIQAPGEFDTDNGRFVIDKQMVDLIKKHNEKNFPQTLTPFQTGHIINTSLQPTISMQIKTSMGNARSVITANLV